MGLSEKYGFTPDQINNLTRNQLLIYSGAVESKKGLEKFALQKQAEGMLHKARESTK